MTTEQAPQLNEIRQFKTDKRNIKYVYKACEDCGQLCWVQYYKVKSGLSIFCKKCAPKHHRIKNRWICSHGRVAVQLFPDDFFYPMADIRGRVYEHRLVVAKALSRNLHSWEVVHHKHNKYPAGSIEDKLDNRYPENLQLVSAERHTQITILENKVQYLEDKVTEQGKLIKLLQWQIKQREVINQ